ncbi:hypothetical protein [Methanosarcina sp. UBA289]|uniref:hypothetical protein n=1 Tax=Methanosarcina sp. UBA289 TaxID=1915574 RepID=UPI0025E40744|nr:hypothetical protein [Methanosarcina sp. UBA289]
MVVLIYGVDFKIKSNGKRIAKVWSSGTIWEIYTVEIEPEQNDALILVIASVLAAEYYIEGKRRDNLLIELGNRDRI